MQTRKVVGRFIKSSSDRVDIDCKRLANEDYNNDDDDDDNAMTFHAILETKTAPNRVSARCWTAKSILLREVSFREGHSQLISFPFKACPTALISEFWATTATTRASRRRTQFYSRKKNDDRARAEFRVLSYKGEASNRGRRGVTLVHFVP